MFVLCKLSSVELLKVRIGKGVANSLTKADFGDELAEECRPTTLSVEAKAALLMAAIRRRECDAKRSSMHSSE